MTPREIFEYALKKGLADKELLLNMKDNKACFRIIDKKSLIVIRLPEGKFVVYVE